MKRNRICRWNFFSIMLDAIKLVKYFRKWDTSTYQCKKDLKFIRLILSVYRWETVSEAFLKRNLPAGKRIPLARISWNFRTYFLWRKKHIGQRPFVISAGSTSNAIIFIYEGQGWKEKNNKENWNWSSINFRHW